MYSLDAVTSVYSQYHSFVEFISVTKGEELVDLWVCLEAWLVGGVNRVSTGLRDIREKCSAIASLRKVYTKCLSNENAFTVTLSDL